MYRFATVIGSHPPSIASAKVRVAGAGALVSNSTQVNVAQAVVRTRPNISSWTCMGARRHNVGQSLTSKDDIEAEESLVSCTLESGLLSLEVSRNPDINKTVYGSFSGISDFEEDEEQLMDSDKDIATSTMEAESEGELWYQLERELKRREGEVEDRNEKEEIAVDQEITEERKVLAEVVDKNQPISTLDITESYRFYPPGCIMHIVSLLSSESSRSKEVINGSNKG